jgi:hypothetical protein
MSNPKKHFLAIVAIFKNEKHILKEWIDHYLLEGVDHFYMIDNGSQDDYRVSIQSYVTAGYVEIIIDEEKYKQPEHYNKYFLRKIKQECEWVLVVDLDEFVYSRLHFETIAHYLRSLDQMIAQIYIPWKEYGSSGHIQQPDGCVGNFIWRKKYSNNESHTKTIFRTRSVRQMWIHHCFLDPNASAKKEITSDGEPKTNTVPYLARISEAILQRSFLHCNHYYGQSFEWYRQTKIPRGSAAGAVNDKAKSIDSYNIWDGRTNQIIDKDLASKHNVSVPKPLYQKNQVFACYGCGQYVDVTQIVMDKLYDKQNKRIVIDRHACLNNYFGDPVPFVKKILIIRVGYTLHICPEYDRSQKIVILTT